MATLVIVPNPAPISTTASVSGAGFPNFKTRLSLDGQGGTSNIFRPRKDGTFNVGINVSTIPATQILIAEQWTGTLWKEITRTSVVVTTLLPLAPSNLIAMAGDQRITVNWGVVNLATTYKIYRNGVLVGTSASPSYVDTVGLVNGQTYSYQVSAVSAAGEGPKSTAISVTLVFSAPVISNILVTSITQTGAAVSWALDQPATGQIEYGPTTTYGTLSTLEPTFLSAHQQTLSGLVAGTLYHFRIKSQNQAGIMVISGDTTFTTLAVVVGPPPAPTNVTATAGDRLVTLGWQ